MDDIALTSTEADWFQIALHASPVAFAYFDPSDRLRLWNTAYEDLNFRIRPLIVEGAYFPDLLSELVVGGQIQIEEGREQEWIDRRLADRRNGITAMRELTDGRAFLVQERPDEIGGVLGFWLDVTELAQSGALRLSPVAADPSAAVNKGATGQIRENLQTIVATLGLLKMGVDAAETDLDCALDAARAIDDLLGRPVGGRSLDGVAGK